MDEPDHITCLEQQHGVDVVGPHPRTEVEMRRRHTRMPLSGRADVRTAGHRIAPLHLNGRKPRVCRPDTVQVIDRDEERTADPPGEGHDPVLGSDHGAGEGSRDVDPPMARAIRVRRRLEPADDWPAHRPLIGPVAGTRIHRGSPSEYLDRQEHRHDE